MRYLHPNFDAARTSDEAPKSDHHHHVPPTGVYEADKLPKDVAWHYRAAGILPYVVRDLRNVHGHVVPSVTFLLGKQDTKSQDRKWRQRWVEFGGKLEPTDDGPVSTALREFHEETSGCFKGAGLRLHSHAIWNRTCKYVLFLAEILGDTSAVLHTNDEICEFRFVDRDALLRALRNGYFGDAEVSFRTRSSIGFAKAVQLLRSL